MANPFFAGFFTGLFTGVMLMIGAVVVGHLMSKKK